MAIVIISNKLNRGGFRILPEGVKLENYKKNPILLFMHRRSTHWNKDDNRLPIGKIENVRLENGQILGDDPIFDEADAFAVQVKNKWEKGMLNAVSCGITPLTISDDQTYLVQGQTRATVVTSELLEVSVVDIPKDGEAVRLNLSNDETVDDILPKLNFKSKNKLPEMDLKNIALQLGLSEKATEAEILNALKDKDATIERLNAARVDEMLTAAGVTEETDKAMYRKLAIADFDATKGLLLKNTPAKEDEKEEVTVGKVLAAAAKSNAKTETLNADDKSTWDFDMWSKKDSKGLLEMKTNEPEKYKALALAYAEK